MMLSLPTLSAVAISAELFSPSRNPCMVKLPQANGLSRYRIDPYCAAVLPPIDISPQFAAMAAAAPRRAAARPTATPPPMAPPLTTSVLAMRSSTPPPQASMRAATESIGSDVATESSNEFQAAAAPLERTHYAVVKFKHDYVWFIAPFRVSVGDMVAVEGDRGENIGSVEEITTDKPDYPVSQRIVRHAAQKDKDHVAMLRRKEAAATKTCQNIAESVGLNIRVVDTEFQYDMNKLTVFFASKVPIDFRKFQRELFREFRCRIWIVNWPRKPAHH